MQTAEISFCDRVSFNIKSDDTKRDILTRLEDQYGIKIIQRHFDKYDANRSPANIQRNPHLVCLRSNGNPYFMYLTRFNFNRYCIFIDKKVQQGYFLPRMIIVPIQFNDSLFEDTLFEGEMTKMQDGRWFYLANDILACKGKHLTNVNLPKRLNLLYQVLHSEYQYDRYDPFRICVKKHFHVNQISTMINEHMSTLPYTTRGIYFRPLFIKFRNILYNFDDDLVKKVNRYKVGSVNKFISGATTEAPPPKQETVVIAPCALPAQGAVNKEKCGDSGSDSGGSKRFFITKTEAPDIYELSDENGVSHGTACVPSLKMSKYLRNIMKEKGILEKVPHLFTFSEKFQKWTPVIATI